MAIQLQVESPPLRDDGSGALRVGNSRVLLELVLRAFQDGVTPEAIVQRYPTVTLGDAYSVIGYYLRHRHEVDEYLARREKEALAVQVRIESQQGDLGNLRSRLQSRRSP